MRCYINTVISLTGSVLASAYVSRLKFGKLDMEIILNATLAGGVGIGTCADFVTNPGIAMIAGLITGSVSALGYIYVTPWLAEKYDLHDTCGIHNLHGMPGVIGALIGAFCFGRIETDMGATNSKLFMDSFSEKNRTP